MKAQKAQQQLGENIICKLCQHYIIDAVTILDCVHSFCRSCLLKHLKESKTCPVCEADLGAKSAKAFKRDFFLQNVIYKLVPEIYWNEVRQRTEYLRKRMISEEEVAFLLDNNMTDLANHLCAPYEKIPLCIEYIRSAPTQEEADEEVSMEWQETTPNVSVIEPSQPGPSGLNDSHKSSSESEGGKSNKTSDKHNVKNKMEVDEIKELGKGATTKHADKRRSNVKRETLNASTPAPPPEFKRYFLAEAKTKLLSIRKVLEGKLKVRENGVQLLFLDSTKDSVLEDNCTLRDVAYMFGWDRRESMKILFTLQREPADDEPPVLTMEEMPVLYKEEPFACQEEEKQDQSAPVIPPVVFPQLTVTLDAAAMEGSGKQQPIIVTGPSQPPRKRRKVSSPTKRTSRTPPYPVQRMTGLSPHEKAPPMMPAQQAKENSSAKKNLLNPTALNGSVMASAAALPSLPSGKQAAKAETKPPSAEKQENLNSRIHEILMHKGLPPPPPTTTAPSTSTSVADTSEKSGLPKAAPSISSTPRPLAPGVAATTIRVSPPSTSCIVPTSAVSQLRSLQPRQDKFDYEILRHFSPIPRFLAPGALHPLCDPRIAHAPIKSILSVPQTDVAPYLRLAATKHIQRF